jgi:hypothetical protein
VNERSIEVLDRVRAAQHAVQAIGALERESLFESIAQRRRGAGMFTLERARQASELPAREIDAEES